MKRVYPRWFVCLCAAIIQAFVGFSNVQVGLGLIAFFLVRIDFSLLELVDNTDYIIEDERTGK